MTAAAYDDVPSYPLAGAEDYGVGRRADGYGSVAVAPAPPAPARPRRPRPAPDRPDQAPDQPHPAPKQRRRAPDQPDQRYPAPDQPRRAPDQPGPPRRLPDRRQAPQPPRQGQRRGAAPARPQPRPAPAFDDLTPRGARPPRPVPRQAPVARVVRKARLRRQARAAAEAARRARFEERPYAGVGILWAVLLVVAIAIGQPTLALLVAPVGVVAAASALRIHRPRRSAPASASAAAVPAPTAPAVPPGPPPRPAPPDPDATGPVPSLQQIQPNGTTRPLTSPPPPPGRPDAPVPAHPLGTREQVQLGLLAAVFAVPFVAIAGPMPAVIVGLVVMVGAASVARRWLDCSPVSAAFAVAAPMIATASVVVGMGKGLAVGGVLIAATCLYDTASAMMGRGPTGGFWGMVAGLATMVVLGFVVIAVADPPYHGKTAWAMCVLAGVLSWLGTRLCRMVITKGGPALPALGRLDSWVVAGPLWLIVATHVLHR